MEIIKNTLMLTALIIVGLFGVCASGGKISKGEYYYGEIIDIYDDGFVIDSRVFSKLSINVGNYTSIKKGSNNHNYFSIGNKVIVVGEKYDAGQVKAKVVRIMKDKERESI